MGGVFMREVKSAVAARTARMRTGANRAERCRRRFLDVFPGGFRDSTYLEAERNYKWSAHLEWHSDLGRDAFRSSLRDGKYVEIATRVVRIESRTNLLFSFEKMALRDAVRTGQGARLFASGLYEFLHGKGEMRTRLERWCEVVASLPRKQTRVLTWPLVTVFGFIAQPDTHMFLKPNVTRIAAESYGFDFRYESRPAWATYASLLSFANVVRRDQGMLKPRDMIDLQSFIWVMGSDEY